TPRLLAAAGNLRAGQSGLGALALAGQVILYHMEHDALVGLNSEYGLGQVDASDLFAGHIKYCYLRHSNSSFPYALTLSWMTTYPPLGPGTAPLIAIRLFSASTLTTV